LQASMSREFGDAERKCLQDACRRAMLDLPDLEAKGALAT